MTIIPPIKPNQFRSFISNYRNADAILPMILLEGAVTSGRAIQANKRDGFNEMRERLTEDVFAAVFWLFSATIFNKMGDFIGNKILKWPVTEFDVGKDALRTPFENLYHDIESGKFPEFKSKGISKEALAGFKFGKIILSTIAAVGLIGFVFPKINQSITKKLYKKKDDEPQGIKQDTPKEVKEEKNVADIKPQENTSLLDKYLDNTKTQANADKANKPSFKGMALAEFMAVTAHQLENSTTYKLLATDVGLISGRAINARNKDERVEILFRDPASSFFYYFATPLTFLGLQKLPFAKLTKLDPDSAQLTHDTIVEKMKDQLTEGMDTKAFKKAVLGESIDFDEILKNVPFENDVVSLVKLTESGVINGALYEKAEKMAGLQPMKLVNGKKTMVLTKRQVQDVLSEGYLNDPKFLLEAYKNKFGKKLLAEYEFISMKDINKFRENIDDYINTVISYAEKHNGGNITKKFLEKMCKRNYMHLSVFTGISFAISALFLSTVIPKTQYLITKWRTGQNKFPGTEGLENNNNTK